jgi:hypothetical protein
MFISDMTRISVKEYGLEKEFQALYDRNREAVQAIKKVVHTDSAYQRAVKSLCGKNHKSWLDDESTAIEDLYGDWIFHVQGEDFWACHVAACLEDLANLQFVRVPLVCARCGKEIELGTACLDTDMTTLICRTCCDEIERSKYNAQITISFAH